ncbi:MAG: alkaline phosphatase D family protein, partial [Burkholderiaceae bacterium]
VVALTLLHLGSVSTPAHAVQAWPVQIRALSTQASALAAQAGTGAGPTPMVPSVRYAVADIEVPQSHRGPVTVQMISLHSYKCADPAGPGEYVDWAQARATQKPAPPIGACASQPSLSLPPNFDPAELLDRLKKYVRDQRAATRMAEPLTLSRQRRTLRNLSQRLITLSPAQWQDPEGGNLSFLAGACRHPGLTGFEFERADASLEHARRQLQKTPYGPRFMLMLGDQIYADARAGVADSQSPIERLLPRYRAAFGASYGFRTLAQRLPLTMVMDDHEINDNWSREQALASHVNQVLAENALNAFDVFQFAHGPGRPPDLSGPTQQVQGFNTAFSHGDYPFIVLDTRSQRRRVPDREMLHSSQWRWLAQWLFAEQGKGSHPKFVVSGSVMLPGLAGNAGELPPRQADTWQMSAYDRKRLLSFIANNGIDNVVFLSSDYHCAAYSEITYTHSPVKTWAIAAPALHAPLRFANVEAHEIMARESIVLTGGQAEVCSTAMAGEGWLQCSLERHDAEYTTLLLQYWLRPLEHANWPTRPQERAWLLSTAAVHDLGEQRVNALFNQALKSAAQSPDHADGAPGPPAPAEC